MEFQSNYNQLETLKPDIQLVMPHESNIYDFFLHPFPLVNSFSAMSITKNVMKRRSVENDNPVPL